MTATQCEPVSVSRRIGAPARAVFDVLADPANHPLLDGSGMLLVCSSGSVITAEGDVFVMRMHNDEMGDYEIANHVVEYQLDRRIGWEPVLRGASRAEDGEDVGVRNGHRWVFELTPSTEGVTDVTEIYDCSRSPSWLRKAVANGNRWVESMSKTLERLEMLSPP